MTTTFENSKGYKVLPLSADEIKVWPRAKTCDRCGRKISSNGFYVGAVNLMYCPDCYEEWHASAPEKQGVLDLRENTYLAKAIGYITNAFSKNKSRKYRIFQIKCLKAGILFYINTFICNVCIGVTQ